MANLPIWRNLPPSCQNWLGPGWEPPFLPLWAVSPTNGGFRCATAYCEGTWEVQLGDDKPPVSHQLANHLLSYCHLPPERSVSSPRLIWSPVPTWVEKQKRANAFQRFASAVRQPMGPRRWQKGPNFNLPPLSPRCTMHFIMYNVYNAHDL